jgi:hypothetical protein
MERVARTVLNFRYLQSSKTNSIFRKLLSLCFRHYSSARTFKVGEKAEISRVFGEEDVVLFAKLTGDTNPIHVDNEFAKQTKFGRCIVHGALVNG